MTRDGARHEIKKEGLLDRQRSLQHTQAHPALNRVNGAERSRIEMADSFGDLMARVARENRPDNRKTPERLSCSARRGTRAARAGLFYSRLDQGFSLDVF